MSNKNPPILSLLLSGIISAGIHAIGIPYHSRHHDKYMLARSPGTTRHTRLTTPILHYHQAPTLITCFR